MIEDRALRVAKKRKRSAEGSQNGSIQDLGFLDGSPAAGGDYLDSDSSVTSDNENPQEPATPATAISAASTPRHRCDRVKAFLCSFEGCSKAFNRPAKLEQHLRSHTNTRPFICQVASCGKSFLRSGHLKDHVKSAHTTIRDFVCPFNSCDKSFLTATRLRRHEAVHSGVDRFRCPTQGCGQIFRKHTTLQAHVIKVHEGKQPFICGFLKPDGKRCNAGFDTVSRLRDHEGRLHQTRRYACSECHTSFAVEQDASDPGQTEVTFSTYSELQDHISTEHPPTCGECGLKYASQRTLRSHIEVRHSAQSRIERKTHLCPESGCSASFTKKGNLNAHLRTIHNPTRFECNYLAIQDLKGVEDWDGSGACGAHFRSRSELAVHIRSSHLGLPYQELGRSNRQKRSQRKRGSVMERLTGGIVGSADLSCPLSECNVMFRHQDEIKAHLAIAHSLTDAEIQSFASVFEDAVEELYLRDSLTGRSTYATEEDLAAERAFEKAIGGLSSRDEGGGAFWLGDGPGLDFQTPSWADEELEMRRLIDED